MLLLKFFGEAKQIFQSPARHDDVLVQLRKAGIAKRVGKFPADFPDLLAFMSAESAFDEQGPLLPDNFFQVANFELNRFLLAVQFDNQMRATAAEVFALCSRVGGGQCEGIRHFERAREKASSENSLNRSR